MATTDDTITVPPNTRVLALDGRPYVLVCATPHCVRTHPLSPDGLAGALMHQLFGPHTDPHLTTWSLNGVLEADPSPAVRALASRQEPDGRGHVRWAS